MPLIVGETNGVVTLTHSEDDDRVYTLRTAALPTPWGVMVSYSRILGVSINWQPVDGATSYDVYTAVTATAGSGKKIGNSKTTSFKDDITEFEVGKTYYYYVVAVSAEGRSTKSHTSSYTRK